MITQKELKEALNYNPNTGIFTRKYNNASFKIGSEVSTKHSKGYITTQINGKQYLAHRLAWLYMTGEFPKFQIDHKDQIKHNNKWKNLREVNNQENHKNMPIQQNNTSGNIGVSWRKDRNKWNSYIVNNNKKINLGSFDDLEDAIIARQQAEIQYGFHANHGR